MSAILAFAFLLGTLGCVLIVLSLLAPSLKAARPVSTLSLLAFVSAAVFAVVDVAISAGLIN
jgi:hypothetical protein